MIGFKVDQAKGLFFDRKAIEQRTDRATRRNLSRIGAYVRQTARGLIRSGKGVSKPGSPPKSHVGLLKRLIFFVFEPSRRSVIIGPAVLNSGDGKAPALLEYGGQTQVRRRGVLVPAEYEPRPYMGPSFEKNESKVSDIWENSIR